MITKFCIISLCMTASVMVGLIYTKSKKSRVEYFESCIKLTDKLISDISFRKENLLDILREFQADEKTELKNHIGKFCDSPFEKFSADGKILKADEKRLLNDFFASLGSTDTQTQLSELENFRVRFADKFQTENEKFKKTGGIGLKLSVLFGLGVGILIL